MPLKKTFIEFFIILFILTISIISFIFIRYKSIIQGKTQNKIYNKTFVIHSKGEPINEFNGVKLYELKNGTYTIGNIDSDYNIIEIIDNKIRVASASCPDKICVSHGFLRDDIDNDMIICAPNNLAIYYN